MNSQQENKLIKTLKRIDLPTALAVVAGISIVGTMISIYALSQRQQYAIFNEAHAQHKLRGITQSNSGTTTNPSETLTTSSTTPKFGGVTVPNGPITITEAPMPSQALTNPDSNTTLGSTTVPNGYTTIPEPPMPSQALTNPNSTTTVPNVSTTTPQAPTLFSRALTNPDSNTTADSTTVPNLPTTFPEAPVLSSGALTTPSTRLPDSFTVRNRFSSTFNSTISKSDISTPSDATTTLGGDKIPHRFLTTPSNPTTLSRAWITPSNTTTPFKLPPSIKQRRRTSIALNSSSTKTKYLEQAIEDANAAAFGLVVAKREGQITPHTPTWRKAQDAIFLLRHGKTRQEAARRAGIPISVLMQLIAWGQNRP